MNTSIRTPARTFLAGLLAVLPIVLTLYIVIWVGNYLHQLAGPGSAMGDMLASIGLAFATDRFVAYLLGFLMVILFIYVLGLVVQSGLTKQLRVMDRVVRRLPLVGSIYDLTNRFVGLFDQKEQADLKAMSPVWCFFGGEGGTAVLALMPNPEPVVLGGHRYHVILVPSAPVPFGGGLLYVPAHWVKPASFGVEALTRIYVTMGVSSPQSADGAPPETAKTPISLNEQGDGNS
jgi:uncharacterized membrane protein